MRLAQALLNLFLFILLVGSALTLLFSFIITEMEGNFLKNAASATATVISIDREPTDNNNYLIEIIFNTNAGLPVETRVNDGKRTALRQGDKITIYYKSENPQEAILASRYRSTKLMSKLGTYAANVLIVAFALIFYLAMRKKAESAKI